MWTEFGRTCGKLFSDNGPCCERWTKEGGVEVCLVGLGTGDVEGGLPGRWVVAIIETNEVDLVGPVKFRVAMLAQMVEGRGSGSVCGFLIEARQFHQQVLELEFEDRGGLWVGKAARFVGVAKPEKPIDTDLQEILLAYKDAKRGKLVSEKSLV